MFIESPIFPTCPSFGYTAQPDISVTITATVSGRERRNRNWQYPLSTYDCTVGPRDEESVQSLRDFFLAMGAQECGFRFLDASDFKSCHVSGVPDQLDQPIILNEDASPPEYQLIKQYVAGPRSMQRKIQKPIEGTLLVAHGGSLITEGSGSGHWSMDYTTGVFTPHFSVTGALTWGGEFHTPTRFNSSLPVQITDKEIMSVQFSMIEIRDPLADDEGSP